MDKSPIVVATTIAYGEVGSLRSELAKNFMTRVVEAGHQLVVIDGSPTAPVRNHFSGLCRDLGATIALEKGPYHTMGASRRQAFALAMNLAGSDNIFVWSEPEKVNLIPVLPEIVQPILNGKFHIIIPSRSAGTWDTYPLYQYKTEQLVNSAFQELFGRPGFDPMFGPMAFSWPTAKLLRDFDPALYGVADGYVQQYIPPLALNLGFRVGNVLVNCPYPAEQKELEDGPDRIVMLGKRFKQGVELIHAFQALKKQLGI